MMQTSISTSSPPNSIRDYVQSGALKHVAIIMDGNRRWAQNHNMLAPQGHHAGYKALKQIVEYCARDIKLPVLTVYAFSTENWRRPDHEVDFLMKLFHQTLQAELGELVDNNIRLRFLGNLDEFSPQLQKEFKAAEAATADNTGMLYQVAANYGGRTEIVEACRKIAQQVQAGTLSPAAITEAHLSAALYTGPAADPDMVIRTGSEYRLSNFLLWQAAYAEICVVDELWPDFTPDVLNRTIVEFQHRQRRFGK